MNWRLDRQHCGKRICEMIVKYLVSSARTNLPTAFPCEKVNASLSTQSAYRAIAGSFADNRTRGLYVVLYPCDRP